VLLEGGKSGEGVSALPYAEEDLHGVGGHDGGDGGQSSKKGRWRTEGKGKEKEKANETEMGRRSGRPVGGDARDEAEMAGVKDPLRTLCGVLHPGQRREDFCEIFAMSTIIWGSLPTNGGE